MKYHKLAYLINLCLIDKRYTVVVLVLELCAHNQFTSWVDNSKTKKAIVFILAHNTRFDRLNLPVKFH